MARKRLGEILVQAGVLDEARLRAAIRPNTRAMVVCTPGNPSGKMFTKADVLFVPSLRDEMLTTSNFTGHPSLTLRAGFVNVSEARSDWAPDPKNPLPKFSPPRRVPHGVTLLGRLFDEGTVARAGIALERAFGVVGERPPGF